MNVTTALEGKSVLFIASAKIPEREGSISPSSFYGQLPDYLSHVFSLIYLLSWWKTQTELHLESHQTSVMEFPYKNSQRP